MEIKPLLINTYDFSGGAAKACYRLHQGVREKGINSTMLVQEKMSNDPSVLRVNHPLYSKVRRKIDYLPLYFYINRQKTTYNIQRLPSLLFSLQLKRIPHNIIHLHWVGNGFFSIEQISKFKKPIIWTMHDSWVFTGGCHVPYDCKKYEKLCNRCPQLGSNKYNDLSHSIWTRKGKAWVNANLTLVSPSNWLADCARKSQLTKNCRIEVIPNGLDLNTFRFFNKNTAKEKLGISTSKRYILFGASRGNLDSNKGLDFVFSILEQLKAYDSDIELLMFGSFTWPKKDVPSNFNNLGFINDENLLAMIYSAADVMIVPSKSENLPYTIMESMACGTPCVAFNVGGISDLIEHKKNGYLAKPFDQNDLAKGVIYILEQGKQLQIPQYCIEKVENSFDIRKVTESYLELYRDILTKGNNFSS